MYETAGNAVLILQLGVSKKLKLAIKSYRPFNKNAFFGDFKLNSTNLQYSSTLQFLCTILVKGLLMN